MSHSLSYSNEQLAAAAFTMQSTSFDNQYLHNGIINYKRERVRSHLKKYITPGNLVLELNSGTGQDAIWLAQQGCKVHATDISGGMQEILHQKLKAENLEKKISCELCSFTELDHLALKGPYDIIFSNFAGLNCTTELHKVLKSFATLLKTNGTVTMVLLPRFCLWEVLLLFKGKFKTAIRRLLTPKETTAHIEGIFFKCRYYNPSYITDRLDEDFNLVALEGLCTLVPPSYIENFDRKFPKLFLHLKQKEDKLKCKWPWRLIGDYYIITLQKK